MNCTGRLWSRLLYWWFYYNSVAVVVATHVYSTILLSLLHLMLLAMLLLELLCRSSPLKLLKIDQTFHGTRTGDGCWDIVVGVSHSDGPWWRGVTTCYHVWLSRCWRILIPIMLCRSHMWKTWWTCVNCWTVGRAVLSFQIDNFRQKQLPLLSRQILHVWDPRLDLC